MELDAANKRLDDLVAAFEKYQKQYSANLHKMETEFHQMEDYCEELENKCRFLNKANHESTISDNQANNEQTSKLEEEIKILRSTMALRDAKYKEEIHNLEKKHSIQISIQQKTIGDLKFEIKNLTGQVAEDSTTNHPAFHDSAKKHNKQGKKVPASSIAFKWPDLDLQKSGGNAQYHKNEPNKKRKKLYHHEDDHTADII